MTTKPIVALCDDESTFLRKFNLIFRKLGTNARLDTFTTSEELIEAYEVGKYIVVLLDQNLKGSNLMGIELGDKIKNELGNNCKVIMVSTSDGSIPYIKDPGKTERQVAEELGLDGWCVKGGVELVDRLQELFKDIEDGNFGRFKVYDK